MSRGTVKFFVKAKGFGFITPDDGGADVFVHASTLERSGLNRLHEGDQVAFELSVDRRPGKRSASYVEMISFASQKGSAGPRTDASSGEEEPHGYEERTRAVMSGAGVVMWFNAMKGFGFIRPNGGGTDVFVHRSALERAGLAALEEGQKISFDLVKDGRTGKTSATNLRLNR